MQDRTHQTDARDAAPVLRRDDGPGPLLARLGDSSPLPCSTASTLAERIAIHADGLRQEVELLRAAGRGVEACWLEDLTHEVAAFAENMRPERLS